MNHLKVEFRDGSIRDPLRIWTLVLECFAEWSDSFENFVFECRMKTSDFEQ